MPEAPGFYSCTSSLEEMVDVMVGRILDVLGIQNDLYERWPSSKVNGKAGAKGNAYNDGDQTGVR